MPIKLKNSQVAGRIPVANDLAIGEVALNTADGKLYTKHSDGIIKLISPSKTDLDLNNVDNTSDANKPVSTAQATAIAIKADVATTYTKAQVDAAVAAAAIATADIVTPTNVSPTDALGSQTNTPTLTGSAFYALYGYTMAASQWQVSTDFTFATALISTGDIAGTTVSYTIPASTLATNTTYYWRCRYKNSVGEYSTWSSVTSFTTPVFVPTVAGTAYAGGFFAGKIVIGGLNYALVVAPKASGENISKQWKTTYITTAGTLSLNDGLSNSNAMNNASHSAAQFCRALTIGGYSDWYLPAKNELEILYRYLKPASTDNATASGANGNSLPVGAAYTTSNPTTSVSLAYTTGNAEAFSPQYYWSSTEFSATGAWVQHFVNGAQYGIGKTGYTYVRAVRKVLI